jgi:hypothetical protein
MGEAATVPSTATMKWPETLPPLLAFEPYQQRRQQHL